MSNKKRKLNSDHESDDDKDITDNTDDDEVIMMKCKSFLEYLEENDADGVDHVVFLKHSDTIHNLRDYLNDWIQSYDDMKKTMEWHDEQNQYPKNETLEQIKKRATKYAEWTVEEQEDDEDCIDYAKKCQCYGDCWYQGNLDRVQGCVIYRLKGTDCVFICDVCRDNDLDHFAEKIQL